MTIYRIEVEKPAWKSPEEMARIFRTPDERAKEPKIWIVQVRKPLAEYKGLSWEPGETIALLPDDDLSPAFCDDEPSRLFNPVDFLPVAFYRRHADESFNVHFQSCPLGRNLYDDSAYQDLPKTDWRKWPPKLYAVHSCRGISCVYAKTDKRARGPRFVKDNLFGPSSSFAEKVRWIEKLARHGERIRPGIVSECTMIDAYRVFLQRKGNPSDFWEHYAQDNADFVIPGPGDNAKTGAGAAKPTLTFNGFSRWPEVTLSVKTDSEEVIVRETKGGKDKGTIPPKTFPNREMKILVTLAENGNNLKQAFRGEPLRDWARQAVSHLNKTLAGLFPDINRSARAISGGKASFYTVLEKTNRDQELAQLIRDQEDDAAGDDIRFNETENPLDETEQLFAEVQERVPESKRLDCYPSEDN